MAEEDVAASAEWPTFDLPADVTRDEPTESTPPATPATPQGATPPAQPPAGTPPATPQGGTPAAPSGDGDVIPKYRLDEQRERFETQLRQQSEQIATLTGLLQKAIGSAAPGPAAPAAEPPTPPDPKDVLIRERLMAVFPELKLLDELKVLAEKKDALLGTADAVGRYQTAETAYYDRYAERTIDSIYDRIAALTLGDGKKAADLDELVKGGVLTTFTRWVTKDPARAARFENEDPKIVDEFWTAYKAAVYDPVRRDSNAALLAAAAQPPALPVGGGGAPVASAPPAKTTGLDEDAVHAAAWARRDQVGV